MAARDGARWARAGDRLVEVERFIRHDAAMNTPPRLARGLPLLGRIHALLADMEVSPAGRAAEFANHIEPGRVLSGTRAGTARIMRWRPTPDERQLAGQAERLAGLVAAGEAGLAAGLPGQLVHGDFWDDNVFFRGQDPVFVADFGFMAERARVDDLALTLYYADTEFGLATARTGSRRCDHWCGPTPAGSADRSPTPNGRHCPGPSPASRCGASAAGSRPSTTNTPPGHTPAPPLPPSDAPCS